MQAQLTKETPLSTFQPAWGPIGDEVFRRTYARKLGKDENGKDIFETWPQTVVRVVDGNLGLVDPKFIEPLEREKLIELLLHFAALPAGRHLSASGIKGRQFLFNCHAAGWDEKEPWAHFTFLFDELMQGGGVGSNYSNRYINPLPEFQRNVEVHVICSDAHPDYDSFKHLLSSPGDVVSDPTDGYEVDETLFYKKLPDSREGWVEAVEHPLMAAWGATKYKKVVLDVSGIRREGEELKTSGGKAPGPRPLVMCIAALGKLLRNVAGTKLNSLTAMKMDHDIAAAVVAGGKRRSSRMSVKNWRDLDIFDFINCKATDGVHWTTNISVEIDDDFIAAFEKDDVQAVKVLEAIVQGKRKNGEPGIWNRSLAAKGEREPEQMFCPNPCGEIGLYMWENCNLGHINLQHFAGRPFRHSVEAFRLMTRWLIRATYGDIPQARQRAVVDKNRRIGVGFFGFHGWLALSGIKYSDCWRTKFVEEALCLWRKTVDAEAVKYADELGIPRPVKTTTVAPTGTVACLPGVSSGLQPIFAPWFKRRVRYNRNDAPLAELKAKGYPHYQDPDADATEIVEFVCEDPLASIVRGRGLDPEELVEAQDDIPFTDYLEVQALVQDVYANNAISFTINIPEHKLPPEPEMVMALAKVLYRLKGTTVFVDKSRLNAPFERLSREEFEMYLGPKEVTQKEDECRNGCPVN